MKFNEDLAAIHAYLCADGYVTKNPKERKYKQYKIGLRNTSKILLGDFQNKFENFFRVKPTIRKEGRCEKSSKVIWSSLILKFNSFHSYEWKMPSLNNKLSSMWLRAFFDCESWIVCKTHQNRCISLDCVNEKGIKQIKKALKDHKIGCKLKKRKDRNTYNLSIYGKENLIKFKKKIGFLHPKKSKKLNKALNDYVIYKWDFPPEKEKCKEFIKKILKEKIRFRKPYYIRIISREKENLTKLSKLLKKFYNLNCLVYKRVNGIGTIYFELNINKKEEIKKLIKLKLIPNLFKFKKF